MVEFRAFAEAADARLGQPGYFGLLAWAPLAAGDVHNPSPFRYYLNYLRDHGGWLE